ncbi:MAG TPA: ThuA domain-containing protein, partial [Polyangiaceae bacterium]|nr:ThuA domain-containing protein [Polyangiaceae bacterium]
MFTKTEGFRHDSIADAQEFFSELPAEQRISATLTEDSAVFDDATLSAYEAVVFANTTGDVLAPAQQAALQRYLRGGHGFVGIHAAADTEAGWPWYVGLVGATFVSHPESPLEVDVHVEEGTHPAVQPFTPQFRFEDEWYNFDRNPREVATVLLSIDERGFTVPNTPPGPSMGADHPVAWYQQYEGARSFYTNLGHRPQTWHDTRFQQHILEGIRWAARGGGFGRAVLTRNAKSPIALAVRPDGDVYFIERTGELKLWRARTGAVEVAFRVEVDTAQENGLLGLALDPSFAKNGFVYLYYSAPLSGEDVAGGPPGRNELARFKSRADGHLDEASRQILLEVPSERRCCHEGGSLAFAADGTLWLATGDNTNPFDSAGAAPLDERTGRETFNAQRTSANPFDLRGKILRIRPDGGVPEGNLFGADERDGRKEIYALGVRNPYRLAADPKLDRVYFSDIGPDAVTDSDRGPRGYDEINWARPGNYGWPYCIAEQLPYANYDFANQSIGAPYDCEGTIPAWMAYDYGTPRYPALGPGLLTDGSVVGRAAIAGAVYRAPAGARFAFPSRFDGALLISDWT